MTSAMVKMKVKTAALPNYVIVIAQVPGIYGSKQTESEGVARGRGLFTTAIDPWPPVL